MGIINKKGNDKDFFDKYVMAHSYNNQKLKDQCQVALQAFLGEPKKAMKAKIQAMAKIQGVGIGVSSDFPIMVTSNFNLTLAADDFDMGWEQAYKQVTLEKNRLFWEIADAEDSLTFFKVEEGQKIEVGGLSGSRIIAYAEYYGGALGWTDAMIRGRKIPMMIDKATVFRNKFWLSKGNIHYALLATAAGLTVIGWQGVAADGRTLRDVMTINLAGFQLGNTNKDKGIGSGVNTGFILYANPFDKDRIEAAFRATTANMLASRENGISITDNIRRIYTYNNSILAGSPILVWPGQKIQKADVMAPTTFGPELDILSLNRVQSVWAIYGSIIADDEQCLQLTLGNP